MLWLRSATELRRAVSRKPRPLTAGDHASSTLMELAGAVMAFDEPRTQPPAEVVRDRERPGGQAEARQGEWGAQR